MIKSRPVVRDSLMAFVLLLAGIATTVSPIQKSEPFQKLGLEGKIPQVIGSWKGETFDTREYADRWQSINELLLREYSKENIYSLRSGQTKVGLIAEFTSDLRQNFSFHFPENCHRAAGNQVEFLKPLEIDLSNSKKLLAKRIFIKGHSKSPEAVDKIVAYWVVMDGIQRHRTFFIKADQMLSGLLSRARKGCLIRVDYVQGLEYSPEGIEKSARVTSGFIQELYESLGAKERELFFGKSLV